MAPRGEGIWLEGSKWHAIASKSALTLRISWKYVHDVMCSQRALNLPVSCTAMKCSDNASAVGCETAGSSRHRVH